MGHRSFWNTMTWASDLSAEPHPREPLVELVGQNRVLIENHLGVLGYECNEICVKVKFGKVVVCGETMVLSRMTKEQLLITGCIESVRFCRREW